jgi:DNA-directed RNA polymerase subunit K/omega
MIYFIYKIKIDIILLKNIISIIIMTKKANKKVSKKEESDDDYEVEENEIEDIDEVDVEEFDDEDISEADEEKDELNIEPETDREGCVIADVIEDDDEYFENNEETEIPVEHSSEFVTKENRISSNRLTKYEMVRILGERTKQLTMGAKPLVKNYQGLPYEKIAEEEFRKNMIPFKIKRPLPNGKFEIWTLDELYKEHLLSQLE